MYGIQIFAYRHDFGKTSQLFSTLKTIIVDSDWYQHPGRMVNHFMQLANKAVLTPFDLAYQWAQAEQELCGRSLIHPPANKPMLYVVLDTLFPDDGSPELVEYKKATISMYDAIAAFQREMERP